MKNLLILYKIIILLFGNFLFSQIHHLNEHSHSSDKPVECIVCENFNNNSSYTYDDQLVRFSKDYTMSYTKLYNSIDSVILTKFLSRAPPISS